VKRVALKSGVEASVVTKVLLGLRAVATESLLESEKFVWPEVLKMKLVRTPATIDREGINPFTKEKMMLKGRPATVRLRITPEAGLSEAVGNSNPDRYDGIEE
jgi:hypothetical protein